MSGILQKIKDAYDTFPERYPHTDQSRISIAEFRRVADNYEIRFRPAGIGSKYDERVLQLVDAQEIFSGNEPSEAYISKETQGIFNVEFDELQSMLKLDEIYHLVGSDKGINKIEQTDSDYHLIQEVYEQLNDLEPSLRELFNSYGRRSASKLFDFAFESDTGGTHYNHDDQVSFSNQTDKLILYAKNDYLKMNDKLELTVQSATYGLVGLESGFEPDRNIIGINLKWNGSPIKSLTSDSDILKVYDVISKIKSLYTGEKSELNRMVFSPNISSDKITPGAIIEHNPQSVLKNPYLFKELGSFDN